MAGNWADLMNLYLSKERENTHNRRTPHSKSRRPSASNLTASPSKSVARFMPTYRLDPKVPFNAEICEKIMKKVIDDALQSYKYSEKEALSLCSQLSDEIKRRVKAKNFDRYRYVCVVTIGEQVMQGYCSMANFLWDATRDGYFSYVYDTPEYFAVATFYYIYYD